MATIYELAMLADMAYHVQKGFTEYDVKAEDGFRLSGWTVAGRLVSPGFKWYNPLKNTVRAFAPPGFCTGVQACFFTRQNSNDQETVLAIKGTKPQKGGDLLADLKIGLQIIPNQASAAKTFYKKYKDTYPNLIVVGHSLGGGLAQCLGYWYDLPFVTFNAPGMMSCLREATGNWTKPTVMSRTSKALARHTLGGGSDADSAQGINIRMSTDAVSKFSTTYGKQLTLPCSKWDPLRAHFMSTVIPAILSDHTVANGTLADLL